MDDTSFDIAMKFVEAGGVPVYAESTLSVHKKDPLMNGFTPITDYDEYSNFFEVETFDFGMSVEPEEAGAGNMNRTVGAPGGRQAGSGTTAGRTPAAGAKGGDRFSSWRSAATEKEAKDMKFQLTFDSFHFTRVIDAASPLFFRNCSRQIPFESAALVKRVATGVPGEPGQHSIAFLRFDFKKVLLKSVKWMDGELVTEECHFTCHELTFQYRQQDQNGHLKPPSSPVTWDRLIDSKRIPDGKS